MPPRPAVSNPNTGFSDFSTGSGIGEWSIYNKFPEAYKQLENFDFKAPVGSKVTSGLSRLSAFGKGFGPLAALFAADSFGKYLGNEISDVLGISPSSSAPSPAVSSGSDSPDSKVQKVVNNTTTIINNNASDVTSKTLEMVSDGQMDLVQVLAKATQVNNQTLVVMNETLNQQLSLLNEQFFGFLAYLDLFLYNDYDRMALDVQNSESFYASAESGGLSLQSYEAMANSLNRLGDATDNHVAATYEVADATYKVSDRLEPFQDNQNYNRTSMDVYDLNGELVAHNAPRAVTLAKDAAFGKGEADTNSMGKELMNEFDDLGADMPDLMKFFKYMKVSDSLAALDPSSSVDLMSILEGKLQ